MVTRMKGSEEGGAFTSLSAVCNVSEDTGACGCKYLGMNTDWIGL